MSHHWNVIREILRRLVTYLKVGQDEWQGRRMTKQLDVITLIHHDIQGHLSAIESHGELSRESRLILLRNLVIDLGKWKPLAVRHSIIKHRHSTPWKRRSQLRLQSLMFELDIQRIILEANGELAEIRKLF
jgi:hypothetical protein